MSEDLKRCPFCGGKAEIIGGEGEFNVRCSNYKDVNGDHCPLVMGGIYYDTKEKAINAWNRRAVIIDEELKRCPFCGGEAEVIKDREKIFYVKCSDIMDVNDVDCTLAMGTVFYDTREKAIRAWNRRANE